MGKSGKTGPSRAWFILPSIMVVAAVFLAGSGFASFLHFVRSDFTAYQPDSSISVTKDGFTLWTEDGAIGAADLRCTATRPDAVVQLSSVAGRTTFSNGRDTFEAIASTPEDLPAGQYVISCVSASGQADVPLYIGPRIDIAAVGRLVGFNIVAPLFLGFCAVVLFVILAVMRYRRRRSTTPTV